MVAYFSTECLNSCHWLAPVLIWRAANQGVTRLGSRGNMELFLILWRSRYNMTTRSRPGRGETGKKLSKGSHAMLVTREETRETTQWMGDALWRFEISLAIHSRVQYERNLINIHQGEKKFHRFQNPTNTERAKDVRTLPTIYRNVSRWPRPSELLSIDTHSM